VKWGGRSGRGKMGGTAGKVRGRSSGGKNGAMDKVRLSSVSFSLLPRRMSSFRPTPKATCPVSLFYFPFFQTHIFSPLFFFKSVARTRLF